MNRHAALKVIFSILVLAWAFAACGQIAYPPSSLFLDIETGMHTANIFRIDVDAGERFLVSFSRDKTVRFWDLVTGKLLQVLRPPEGDGAEGEIYAVAISPDGSSIAVGGFTGRHGQNKCVYLFDRSTGVLIKRDTRVPQQRLPGSRK